MNAIETAEVRGTHFQSRGQRRQSKHLGSIGMRSLLPQPFKTVHGAEERASYCFASEGLWRIDSKQAQWSSHEHGWGLQSFSLWVQFSSVTQSYLTLCDPMDCSTPGFPVHHQPPEFTQTHVHWVGDAIQSSHPLSSPSPPAFSLSQHHGLLI